MRTTHIPIATLSCSLLACGGLDSEEALLSTTEAITTRELRAWFSGYNGNSGTNYLSAPHTGTYYANGDSRMSTRHVAVKNGRYGPQQRHRFDVWIPTHAGVTGPTPIAIYYHGGGFVTGGREDVEVPVVDYYLSQGIAVASVDYRYAYRDASEALAEGTPNDAGTNANTNGARLDNILRDCARAVQFFKYRGTAWNIDQNRVGVFGHSAGGGCAAWVAAAPNLAVARHSDPVLRKSTRVAVALHLGSQITYNFQQWGNRLGLSQSWLNTEAEGFANMTQMTASDQRNTTEGQQLMSVLDFQVLLSSDDPPLYIFNPASLASEEDISSDSTLVLHDPRNAYGLYDSCVARGAECELDVLDQSRDTGYPYGPYYYLVEALRR